MAEAKLFSVKNDYKQPAERQDKGNYEMFLKGQSTGQPPREPAFDLQAISHTDFLDAVIYYSHILRIFSVLEETKRSLIYL